MKQLYTPEEAQRWRQRAALTLGISVGAVVLALIVCIILCTQVSTANAAAMLVWCIVLFTLAGWTCILTMYFSYAPAKAQSEHIRGMLAEEPRISEGVLTLHRETFRIPKSITVRKATLATDGGDLSLSVSAGLARQLPRDGVRLRIWTVRRFITAYEVIK